MEGPRLFRAGKADQRFSAGGGTQKGQASSILYDWPSGVARRPGSDMDTSEGRGNLTTIGVFKCFREGCQSHRLRVCPGGVLAEPARKHSGTLSIRHHQVLALSDNSSAPRTVQSSDREVDRSSRAMSENVGANIKSSLYNYVYESDARGEEEAQAPARGQQAAAYLFKESFGQVGSYHSAKAGLGDSSRTGARRSNANGSSRLNASSR